MINDITTDTNKYINNIKGNYSRERDCSSTSPAEIKAVIGILYMAGVFSSELGRSMVPRWNRC